MYGLPSVVIEVVDHVDVVVHVDAPVPLQDQEAQHIGLQQAPEILIIVSCM